MNKSGPFKPEPLAENKKQLEQCDVAHGVGAWGDMLESALIIRQNCQILERLETDSVLHSDSSSASRF